MSKIKYSHKYSGNLEFYHESGMEQMACILHDDRGIYKSPGFNNDTKKWDGPVEDFKSLEWTVWFKGGEYIKITHPETNEVVFEGKITKNIDLIRQKNYNFSFLPSEIKYEEWLSWCQHEYKAEVQTNNPVLADDGPNSVRFVVKE